ncbi:hypothetical protein Acr_25g0004030 [Actinidia rufa]|uniref:Membrane protein of ER body-like protein n=1 Tax=Actinidia rufa TaxID=165716 RepID=A0A7J0GZN9_9ERIC|nr:hypothetical protein Acr_25g0004030 [Actinidia rufa]
MEVAEQQQQWQEEAEEREEGVALQGRRTRHLAAAGSIAVSDDVMLPSSERVNEFEEEEEEKYHQEAEEREEAVLQRRQPPHPTAAAVAVIDNVMLLSSERVNEFEEEEEEKYHQVAEEREEAVLQRRQPPHPTAAAVAVIDNVMLPSSERVNEFEEEEEEKYHQEAEEREEAVLQGRQPLHPTAATAAVAVSDDLMLPLSQPVTGFEEEEEEYHQEPEEREEEEEALHGRRPRHPAAAAAAVVVGDDVMMPSSKPVNGLEEEDQQKKFQDGMWKCRNCCWTYESGSPWTDHTQHSKWYLHMLMNSKTVDQWGHCSFCETEERKKDPRAVGSSMKHEHLARGHTAFPKSVATRQSECRSRLLPRRILLEYQHYYPDGTVYGLPSSLETLNTYHGCLKLAPSCLKTISRSRSICCYLLVMNSSSCWRANNPIACMIPPPPGQYRLRKLNGLGQDSLVKLQLVKFCPCSTLGTESIYGSYFTENKGFQGSASEKNPGDDGLAVTIQNFDSQKGHDPIISHQYKENLKDDSFAGFRLLSSENLSEEHKTNKSFSDITEPHDEIEPIKEIDQELTELDVERVLEKQDTHHLYCPNCNSCITGRVILRKRKRKIRISGEDANRNRSETKVAYELDAISAHATNDQGRNVDDIPLDSNLTPAANDYNRDREPELFRCLSCFSFFIPTGSDLKVDVEENIVGATKLEVTMLPQSFDAQGLRKNSIIAKPQEGGDHNVPSSTQDPIQLGKVIADSGDKLNDVMNQGTEGLALDHLALETVHQLDSSNGTVTINGSDHPATQLAGRTPAHSEEPAEDIVFRPHQDGLKILIHSSAETLTIEKSQMNQKLNVAIERKSADDKDSKFIKPIPELGESDINEKVNIVRDLSSENGQNIGATLPTRSIVEATNADVKISAFSSVASQHVLIGSKVDTLMEEPLKADKGSLSLSVQDALLLQDRRVDINKDSNDIPTKVGIIGRDLGCVHSTVLSMQCGAHSELNNMIKAYYSSGAAQYAIIGTKVDIRMEEPLKSDKDAFSLSVQDALLLQDRQFNIDKVSMDTPPKVSEGQDTIIIVKDGPAQEAQGIISAQETRPSTRTESAETVEFRGLEILKSMVYGGLIESIASLGIVSSAAGADATTLNILALGVANLIGGLFLMLHNMWELKNDHSSGTSNQVTEGAADRYKELLGRRENFLLHATVAVLSFLIFGLLPPVVYGFSFRESNNGDFKLIAVAVASLLCIIIFAIGKAYVQRPPKSYLKTIIYFVIMGFAASGISYAAGDLFKKLIDKLGWFNSSVTLTMPVLETIPVQPGWGSY